MALYEFEGKRPEIDPTTFIHPDAVIIGNVTLAAGCYVGAGAVLRADWGIINVGEGSNIQENCVFHVRPDEPVTLGPSSHIGHASILHGCTLGVHVLVGMGSIINDEVEIGDGCVLGAGCVLPAGKKIPAGKLVVGVPGRIIGDVSEKLRELSDWGTKEYQALPPRYFKSFKRID